LSTHRRTKRSCGRGSRRGSWNRACSTLPISRFKGRRVYLVRYADDFIITGEDRSVLSDEVMGMVRSFLEERGLELAEEKTRIVHIDDGFDFLGFNLRRYTGKLLIKPAKSNIAAVRRRVHDILHQCCSQPQSVVIERLNPVLRGWAYFYRHVVSQQTYDSLDNAIWQMTWNWARRRHPRKGPQWVKDRYYARQGSRDWVFTDGTSTLFTLAKVPIRRYFPIRQDANPYDPPWTAYFRQRAGKS
jgi:RNA-directed DNA polymerase